MSEIVSKGAPASAVSERELMDTLKNSLYPGASDASVAMVLGYCRAASLDPMKKPVHIVPVWNKAAGAMIDVIMPGIALYRIEAARTGEYAGKSEPEFGPDKTMTLGGVQVRFPEWCRVTVRRIVGGTVCEFPAKEYWLENYATAKKDTDAPNAMWKKRAYGQLAKCAEAQALRMAFPEQTGGTNTDDEMAGKSFSDEPRRLTQESRTIEHQPETRKIDYVKLMTERAKKCRGVQDAINLRSQWVATTAKAEEVGRPIPDDEQAQVYELIEARQDELAAAFATQNTEREEEIPA